VEGIALCLSRSARPGDATLDVRNTGAKDAVLKLGVIVGAQQYPISITLVLTDAEGTEHHAELAEPEGVIGGRIEPFIVPPPSGASLKLPIHISKSTLWYAGGQLQDFGPDPKQRYTVQAQFTGKGVSEGEADPDIKGMALWPYWTGTAVSNIVALGPR
jgi:hypothetical protein